MRDQELGRKTTYLRDYTPPAYQITDTSLRFELGETQTRVHAALELVRQPEHNGAGSLTLHGDALKLLDVKINGRKLPEAAYSHGPGFLTLKSPPPEFTLETIVEIHPENNTALSGLYQSHGNFCTQCEAQGFRRMTYYLDRPDVMARFRVRIEADRKKYPVLLSNGNLVEEGSLAGERHFAVWEDPFPKPSYLFALVAGDLAVHESHFDTCSGRRVTLRIYVEHHNLDKCDHAMTALKRAMQWDEERFGREYDLDVYMIVAVDDFNMGAMENKGLNLFNSKYVLAHPATDADFESILAVIGHEYFHNWTGNRVTLRDWFQLSLKEGLTVFREQSFAADCASAAVRRIHDVRFLRQFQFPEDAGPMAHPVRPDSYIEINNFYTATVYEKGAEVVRMYETLLGREGFRRGMDLYFKRHDGKAVTTDDFLSAMADANHIELSQFRRWYETAGTPIVEVTDSWDETEARYVLRMKQSRPALAQTERFSELPLLIPVRTALLGRDGTQIPATLHEKGAQTATLKNHTLKLHQCEQEFVFTGLSEKPLPSLLRDFSAPIKLRYDYTLDQLIFLATHETDPFNRWDAVQRLWMDVLMKHTTAIIEGQRPQMPEMILRVVESLLTQKELDPALVAEALTLPAETMLAQEFTPACVDAIHLARQGIRETISSRLAHLLKTTYTNHQTHGNYQYNATDAGHRRLHNLALDLWAANDNPEALTAAYRQFQLANNMTDRLAALRTLTESNDARREQALAEFRAEHTHDPLVLDKWFALQATSQHDDTLDRVQHLMSDPAFSIHNPNRVRALIGAFAVQNHYQFHRADGAGYRFVADQVLALDRLNPQVAARLVTAFAHWQRYDEKRQSQMRSELGRMASSQSLSRDVYEIVSRSLGES